jgi:hypothetical protein
MNLASNTGSPPQQAFACVRGAARPLPWTTLHHICFNTNVIDHDRI